MGYLGRDIQYGSFAKQTLTANSSTTVFTLSNGVADANNLLVSIGGIIQEPNVAYTAIGTVITFASAPVTNDPIFITFLGMETTTAGSSRDDVTYQIGTGNGTTTPITLSMSVVNSDAIRVSLNGVVQKPWTDFTASGTTLTFSTAPDATNEILVYYIGKENSISDVATGSVTAAKFAASGTMPAWVGTNITNIDVLPYSKFNDLKHNLALIGFRRSQNYGTSNLDLSNGFIDQFEDQTNVDDDASVNENYDATNDYYTNKSVTTIDSNTLVLISSHTTNGSTVFTDLSSTGYAVTSTNVSHSTTKKKFGTTSMKFTGNGGSSPASHVQIAHTDAFDLPGDFTIEFWFNTVSSDHSGNGGSLVTKHQPAVTTTQIGFRDSSNGQLMIQAHGHNGLFGPTGLHDGNWHHVAWVRNGTGTNNIKCYVDGNQELQYTSTEPWFKASATGSLNLGSYGSSEFYGGYMDEFRMSDVARYTGNFTPTAVGFNPAAVPADNMTLVSESETAATAPEKSYVTLFLNNAEPDIPDTRPQIPQSTGTIIASIGTGPSAAGKLWDGDRTSGESGTGSNDYTGKDWGNGVTKIVTGFKVWNHENTHGMNVGGATIEGILQGSQDGSNWTQLATSGTVNDGQGQPTPCLVMNVMSGVTATTAYRYHRVLFQGYSTDIRWGEIEFYETVAGSAGAVITPNTDIMAWVSRSNKTITATNASNVLNATAHGLSNGDRVILTTSVSDLPNGLSETAYHVVNKTANTFQVAATNGGAAITFSDDGTGTHTAYNVTSVSLADKGDYGTGKAIFAGTADITGQPTGTDVRLIVQTKNNKETNLHGTAVQYGKKDA